MTTASSAWESAPLIPLPHPGEGRGEGRGEGYGHGHERCGTCGQPIGFWAVDRLTGLLDRWGWDTYAPEALRHACEQRQPLALLLLDLDHFKAVNDRYGHVAGDMVLHAVADVLRSVCRESDVLGRYGGHGGDEFLVLLPATNRDRALAVATRVLDGVRALRTSVPDVDRGVRTTLTGLSVSIGAALYVPARGIEPDLTDLVLEADAALLVAKREGRDSVRVGRRR